MIQSLARVLLFAATLGVPLAAVAQSPADATGEAVRAALLGDAGRVRAIAAERAETEAKCDDRADTETLSSGLAALAGVTRRPMLDRRETRKQIDGFDGTNSTESVFRLLERVEPRERYAEARASRVYEQRRVVVNSVSGAVFSVLQLQLFGLIQPPLDAIEYIAVGHRYLNPEQRRELAAARAVQSLPADVPHPSGADKVAKKWPRKRIDTSALQARANARRASEAGRLEIADWWYRREMILRGADKPLRDEHRDVLRRREEEERLRRDATTVRDGEVSTTSTAQLAGMLGVLRLSLLDPASSGIPPLARDLRRSEPPVGVLAASVVIASVNSRANAKPDDARVLWDRVAASRDPYWAPAMQAYLRRPEFVPEVAFERVHAAFADRRRDYILYSEDPRVQTRSLAAEDARLGESSWIRAARSVFVIDMVSRLVTLPLIPSAQFPRDELFDAYRSAPPAFLASPQGREETKAAMIAYGRMKRFGEAAEVARRLGLSDEAAAYTRKAARELEKTGEGYEDPANRVDVWRRLLSAYPDYSKRARVEKRLRDDEDRVFALAVVDRGEIDAWPEIINSTGLIIPGKYLDGSDANGEIDKQGIRLFPDDLVVWTDRATGKRVEFTARAGRVERVLAMLYPRRRARSMRDELDKPLERKRIPIMIEGSAGPGLEAAPGLVPLEPDEAKRRLYQ